MHSDWEAWFLDVHRLWTVYHWISLHLNSLLEPVQAVSGRVFLPITLSFRFFLFLLCQHIATCASFKPLVVGEVPPPPSQWSPDVLHNPRASWGLCPLPAHTNQQGTTSPCFSSWSLSSPWLHFLLSLLGRGFLEICVLWYLRAKQHGSIQNSKKRIPCPKNSAFDTCWSYFQSAIIPWSQLWSVYS